MILHYLALRTIPCHAAHNRTLGCAILHNITPPLILYRLTLHYMALLTHIYFYTLTYKCALLPLHTRYIHTSITYKHEYVTLHYVPWHCISLHFITTPYIHHMQAYVLIHYSMSYLLHYAALHELDRLASHYMWDITWHYSTS